LTEEAYRIIKSIRQMEASLEDHKSNDNYTLEDEELKATVPLQQCIKGLKEKHNAVAKVHRERFEQVKSGCYKTMMLHDY
jgi:protein regulator of cytokinesis 1